MALKDTLHPRAPPPPHLSKTTGGGLRTRTTLHSTFSGHSHHRAWRALHICVTERRTERPDRSRLQRKLRRGCIEDVYRSTLHTGVRPIARAYRVTDQLYARGCLEKDSRANNQKANDKKLNVQVHLHVGGQQFSPATFR